MTELEHIEIPAISDCPIQPQVWRAYSDVGLPGVDEERIEVIAHLRPDVDAHTVAEQIVQTASGSLAGLSPLLFDRYLLLDVTVQDLVRHLLPLTHWSDFLQRIRQATIDDPGLIDRQAEAVEQLTADRGPNGQPGTAHRLLGHEDLGRLRWLLSVLLKTGLAQREAAQHVRFAAQATLRGPSSILSVGHNRWTEPAVDVTSLTIKADAARRLFEIDCSDITWAVVDTGIDAEHAMFRDADLPDADPQAVPPGHATPPSRVIETYDIPRAINELRLRNGGMGMDAISTDSDWEQFAQAARIDETTPWDAAQSRFETGINDHGTHVAGVLGGARQERREIEGDSWGANLLGDEPDAICGLCPSIRLVDIRVFDNAGRSREMDVVVGLAFIRWLNRVRSRKIDGVNLSISVPFAVDNFACGWTPVCVECDRLTASGVLVVTSAGNGGYDRVVGPTSIGAGFQSMSISDPGNARSVITVGATDRRDPHRFGPIARSARGPTADGRHKPDVLAPGDGVWGPVPHDGWGRKSGTSQAAPHASAIAAMLMHRYPELRGRPDRVKEIICETATDLGRLADFQGHGLVDALRALQHP